MTLESRVLLEGDRLDGTATALACVARAGCDVVPTHHVTVVSLDSSATLQLGWVLDVLAEANRIQDAHRFTWDVLSLADYCDISRHGNAHRHGASFQSHSAVFIAGDRLGVELNDLARERFRRAVRQLDLALACGPAVELFAACSLLHGHAAAACRATSLWLREEFPGTSFRSEPLCWTGTIGTSTGGVAISAAMLELLVRLGLAQLSREIRGRLLLPTLKVAQPGLSPRVRFGARSSKVVRAISFMQQNLEGPLSVDVVASHVGSSVRQLERLFKVQMKTTPARFLKRLRLEQAEALLLNTELSVVQIVCATGFESPTHFSKSFRRHSAMSPTKWRDAKRRRQIVGGEGKPGGGRHAQRAANSGAAGTILGNRIGAGADVVSGS